MLEFLSFSINPFHFFILHFQRLSLTAKPCSSHATCIALPFNFSKNLFPVYEQSEKKENTEFRELLGMGRVSLVTPW